VEELPRQSRHHFDRVCAADADRACAGAACVRGVRVRADDHVGGEAVLLDHDLVDDARARPPEAGAEFRSGGLQEVIDLAVFVDRFLQVGRSTGACLDQVVAVDGGRHRDGGAAGLHELEEGALAEHVLEDDAVGAQKELRLAGLELLIFRVVEVAVENLVGERERAVEALADDREALVHCFIHAGRHFRRGFDLGHV